MVDLFRQKEVPQPVSWQMIIKTLEADVQAMDNVTEKTTDLILSRRIWLLFIMICKIYKLWYCQSYDLVMTRIVKHDNNKIL